MPSDSRPLADELATHAGFLRALARGMLADEHLAEDVVQQAYLRALARPPESRGFLRAWLARVVRRLALNAVRGEARRDARERMAARPELDTSGERARERAALELALQREVASALAELDEPYRTVVHLRYFRGLAPSAIAQELGVPPKTIETRLTRAHARLRQRLTRAWEEQDERSRAVWLAALPGSGKVLAGVLMTKQVVLVGVGGAVLVGLVLMWRALEAPATRAEAPVVAGERSSVPPAVVSVEAEREEAREELAPVVEASPSEPGPAPSSAPDELAAKLDRLSLMLDRSLEGRLDPGAILDAALLVAAHDVGAPLPELQLNGTLAIPIEGLPEGVSAELSVASPLKKPFLSLTVHLPRSRQFFFDEIERTGPTVYIGAHFDDSQELRSLSILTDVSEVESALARRGSYRYAFGTRLATPLDDPHGWELTLYENEVTEIPDGQRQQIKERLVPQVLEGGPWPRVDDMRRFSRRLKELHELAKSRAAR